MLLIFDRDENLVAALEKGNKKACPYYDGKVKSVLNGEQTLTFRAPYNHEDAKKIVERGYVARKNKFGQWQLFLITEIVEVHSESNLEIEIFAENSFVELADIFIERQTFDRKQPAAVLGGLLNGTRWTLGQVTGTGTHDLTIDKLSLLDALQAFKDRWGVELNFRIEVAGNKISKRIIDCHDIKGAWRGKRFEYSKDLTEITRTIDAKSVKSALYVYGKELESTTDSTTTTEETEKPRMTIEKIAWSKTAGNPIDKPLGQKFIEDVAATKLWGKPLQAGSTAKQPLFALFESNDAETEADLIQAAWDHLQTINKPLVTYAAKVIDLFKIMGIESEIVELGDTAAIIDRDLDLQLQARIIETEEDLDRPENDSLTLGNFEPTFLNITKQIDELQRQIQNITMPEIDTSNLATREDLEQFATREDLQNTVKLEDIADMLTTEDLATLATKADVDGMVTLEQLAPYIQEGDLERYAQLTDLDQYALKTALDDYLKAGDVINPSWIDTAFEFAKDKIATGSGTVILNEGDGLLIVDNPSNPQKAIKLQAGQIALANSRDLATNSFNWRNFGTGEGWLADLVETGFLKFDRSKGGRLQLGGEILGTTEEGAPLYENGVLSVLNSQGDIIAELNGDYGGFGDLKIDVLHDTQNVVFSTFNGSPQNSGGTIFYYVDPYDGNDMNDGSESAPLLTIQEAINRLPKYLDRNVFIRFSFGLLADSEIKIWGFMGSGQIIIQKWAIQARYIKDFVAGSDKNTAAHWHEVRASNTANALVYANSKTYPERITTNSPYGTAGIDVVSDNTLTGYFDGGSNPNADGTLNPIWVEVYLNGAHDLAKVAVWHYYQDGRTYNATKTQISTDRNRWFTIFDSEREGRYKETADGHVMWTNRAYLKGVINIERNTCVVVVEDLFIDGTDETTYPVLCSHNIAINVGNCVIFGNPTVNYCIYYINSRGQVINTEVNTSRVAGIIGAYGSRMEVRDCTGGGFPTGLIAYADSIVGGAGTGPSATTLKQSQVGGVINATWTATKGQFSPITVVEKKATFTNTASKTWDNGNSWWRSSDNEVQQGYWGGYGLYKGFWFFGTSMRNTVVNKDIIRIRVYVTRTNSGGLTSAATVYLRYHGHASQSSGAPTINTSTSKAVALTRGQGAWVDVTNEFKAAFKAGSAYGIGVYTGSTAQSQYARLTTSCKVEITYRESV